MQVLAHTSVKPFVARTASAPCRRTVLVVKAQKPAAVKCVMDHLHAHLHFQSIARCFGWLCRKALKLELCPASSSALYSYFLGSCWRRDVSAVIKPAALTVLSNVLLSMPAHAEAGKIFDFNLTLPIMAGQFLLLMVFLDKAWFTPVGKLLDERDAELRSKLAIVKDNSGEVAKLQVHTDTRYLAVFWL